MHPMNFPRPAQLKQMKVFKVRSVELALISKNLLPASVKLRRDRGPSFPSANQNPPHAGRKTSHCCLDDSFRHSHRSSLLWQMWLMTSTMCRTQVV